MKKILLVSVLVLCSLKAFSQDEGSEQAVTSQENTEAPVGSTDGQKVTKPKSRLKQKKNMPPNESSSFIGDPDNLDPLNPNRDNLKDDNEPVLEDIKDVLNAKKPKKPAEPAPAEKGAAATTPTEPPPPVVETAPVPVAEPLPEPPPPVVETAPSPAPITEPLPEPPPAVTSSNLNADGPDLELEKKFHDIFKRYNINPTPDDVWAVASGKQTARLYEVQKGDTLWSISKILFGDPNFWPKLWSLNKQGILNPHFINPKMKIYFYEGDEENTPTLTVGENQPVEEPAEEKPEEKPEEPAADVAEASTNKEIKSDKTDDKPVLAKGEDFIDPKARVERKTSKKPIPIPSSLPDSFNEKYYGLTKKKEFNIKIDLGQPPKSEFYYNNDIVITDIPAQGEVEVKLSEVQKLGCRPGRLFKDIVFSGTLLNEYDIYEKIDGVESTSGYKHSYRFAGRAKSYQDKYLRVVDCKGIMTTDLVILPRDKMKELATQTITDAPEVKLIGGPDIREQLFYSTLHYAYVDFGPQKFTVGQEFKTISDLTDKVNGEFKVVEKYGSFAVVVITNIMDQITIGDKVVIQ